MKPSIKQLEDRIRFLETELEEARNNINPDDYMFRWLERSNDLVLIIQNGIIKQINPRVKKLLGYEIDEAIGKKFIDHLPGESRQELADRYQRRMKGEKVADYYESILEHKNGEKVFVGISAIFFNYIGKPADLIIIHDITELKQSLEALRISEEKYRSFFKTSKDCVFFTSRDGEWLDMSDSTPEFFGYQSKEELMKLNIKELYYYPEQRKVDIKDIELKGFSRDVPLSLRKNNGTIINALVTSLAIEDEHGKVYAYHGIIRDITQQKKDEKALKESKKHLEELNASKDKFFSIISHDLRTPFNAIIGFSELLREGDYSPAEIREIAGDLYNTGKETYDLLNNLLEWSRSETGKIKFTPTLFQLSSVIDSAVKLLNELAARKNISITIDVPKNVQTFADKNMLMTILRNLISNAIKFTHKGGSIKINAKEEQNIISINVIDTGIGIPNELLDKLFDLEKGVTTRGTDGESGSGLGLLLCKEFTNKNNGDICVSSEAGIGTTITVRLPKHL